MPANTHTHTHTDMRAQRGWNWDERWEQEGVTTVPQQFHVQCPPTFRHMHSTLTGITLQPMNDKIMNCILSSLTDPQMMHSNLQGVTTECIIKAK